MLISLYFYLIWPLSLVWVFWNPNEWLYWKAVIYPRDPWHSANLLMYQAKVKIKCQTENESKSIPTKMNLLTWTMDNWVSSYWGIEVSPFEVSTNWPIWSQNLKKSVNLSFKLAGFLLGVPSQIWLIQKKENIYETFRIISRLVTLNDYSKREGKSKTTTLSKTFSLLSPSNSANQYKISLWCPDLGAFLALSLHYMEHA